VEISSGIAADTGFPSPSASGAPMKPLEHIVTTSIGVFIGVMAGGMVLMVVAEMIK
jgi:hypothetical protein